jgi:hypothetical protein
LDQFDAQFVQKASLRRAAHQRPHRVSPLNQIRAKIASQKARRAGDEDHDYPISLTDLRGVKIEIAVPPTSHPEFLPLFLHQGRFYSFSPKSQASVEPALSSCQSLRENAKAARSLDRYARRQSCPPDLRPPSKE